MDGWMDGWMDGRVVTTIKANQAHCINSIASLA